MQPFRCLNETILSALMLTLLVPCLVHAQGGTVWTWGQNKYGQLGDGTTNNRGIPAQVPGLSNVIAIAGSPSRHVLALTSAGTVWAWGHNHRGQLGDGTTINRSIPTPVLGLSNVIAVAAGGGYVEGVDASGMTGHSLALTSDGTVWTWGRGGNGELSDFSTRTNWADLYGELCSPVPVQVLMQDGSALSGVVGVAAGRDNSYAIRSDGTLWAWGGNYYGDLGDELPNYGGRRAPVQAAISDVIAIASDGNQFTVAITIDGAVWTWGFNYKGQLGDGTKDVTRVTPRKVAGISDVVSIGAGEEYSLAVRRDGTVWACGQNRDGQLGDGTTVDRLNYVQVSAISNVTAVAGGQADTIAFKSDGTLWWWGCYGQSPRPVQVAGMSNVVAVSYGPDFCLALRREETTLCIDASDRRVRVPEGGTAAVRVRLSAQPVGTVTVSAACTSGDSDLTVTCGSNLTFTGTNWNTYQDVTVAADWDADVENGGATLTLSAPGLSPTTVSVTEMDGDATLTVETSPGGTVLPYGDMVVRKGLATSISAAANPGYRFVGWTGARQWVTIADAAASNTSVVVTAPARIRACFSDCTRNTVYAWGYNLRGQLGLGDGTRLGPANNTCLTPAVIPGLFDVSAIAAGASHSHTVALHADRTVWSFGNNDWGELGLGRIVEGAWLVPAQAGIADVRAIAVGRKHTVAARCDGSVWTWGENGYGQMGDGTVGRAPGYYSAEGRYIPQQVAGLSNVIAVAAGGEHTVALSADGKLWAWGGNGYGQLGDGTITERFLPVQVSGITGVTHIAAGLFQTVARTMDGTCWAWGRNDFGQLGNGGTANSSTPVKVANLSNVVAVACGQWHTVANLQDGTAWAWGYNPFGQIGDGTSGTNRLTPMKVTGISNVTAIAAGMYHTVAAGRDGSVWTWGNNWYGQLGNGTTNPGSVPMLVPGLSNIISVAAGAFHTLAIRNPQSRAGIVTRTQVNVPEGGTATFQVKLAAQPTGSVTVAVGWTDGDADIRVSGGASLTFTSSNWDTYQPVTLAAAEDADADNGGAQIGLSGADFDAVVTATEAENDATLIIYASAGGEVSPNGAIVVTKGVAATAIAATAKGGYAFTNWTVISGSATITDANAANTTVTIDAPATVQANFTVGNDPDTDGDGLLDSVDPDDDNDGMSDVDEAVAGTDPTNRLSVLCLTAPDFRAPSSEFVIRWQSASNRWYTVQAATNLLTGFGPIPGASNISATYPVNVYTDDTATVGQKFYRIKVRE